MDKNKTQTQTKLETKEVGKPSQKIEVKPDVAEKQNKMGTYIGAGIIIIAGIISGYFLSQSNSKVSTSGEMVESEKVVGSKDTKAFPDLAEGDLEEGGIDGEGTHKLIRPGGESQTVYLTSSVVDLDEFIGKKVKVRGQTLSAKNAGWLMDVGLVEIME